MLFQIVVGLGMFGLAVLAWHIVAGHKSSPDGKGATMLSPRSSGEFHDRYKDRPPY